MTTIEIIIIVVVSVIALALSYILGKLEVKE